MAKQLKADTGQMARMYAGHQEMHAQVGQLLNQFGGHIDTIQGAWTGPAASAGVPALRAVHQSGAQLHNIQAQIAEKVNQTLNLQANTNDQTTQSAQQFGAVANGGLPGLPGL